MAATLVHASDVHLETTFTDLRGGARRRAALADALIRIVDLAIERHADALTLGGDLYEDGRAGPQTARFLFEQLSRFGGPVFIAPGNHDPYHARSIYARGDRPANVHVFTDTGWSSAGSFEGFTLHGFGHGPSEPGRPFAGASFDGAGPRIAMVHGSDEQRCPPGKRATAPFTMEEIRASGATLVLSGHYHGGYVSGDRGVPALVYPGSPEPIKFGERGTHGAAVITIDGARVAVEPVELARTRLLDREALLADAGSESAVLAAVEAALSGCGTHDYVRLRLTGTVAIGTRIDTELIAERCGSGVGALDVIDDTIAADYTALTREPNVRGRVITDLMALAEAGNVDARCALRYTVAAFDGVEPAPE
jgi:DNA repair exonuclease SbcCD nuclease subunit